MNLLPFELSKKAAKQLAKIKKSDKALYQKIKSGIKVLREDPYVGEMKKGDLKGYYCLDIQHIRTNYEMCYEIKRNEQGEIIGIVFLGPRENFYENLKRYLF